MFLLKLKFVLLCDSITFRYRANALEVFMTVLADLKEFMVSEQFIVQLFVDGEPQIYFHDWECFWTSTYAGSSTAVFIKAEEERDDVLSITMQDGDESIIYISYNSLEGPSELRLDTTLEYPFFAMAIQGLTLNICPVPA